MIEKQETKMKALRHHRRASTRPSSQNSRVRGLLLHELHRRTTTLTQQFDALLEEHIELFEERRSRSISQWVRAGFCGFAS